MFYCPDFLNICNKLWGLLDCYKASQTSHSVTTYIQFAALSVLYKTAAEMFFNSSEVASLVQDASGDGPYNSTWQHLIVFG